MSLLIFFWAISLVSQLGKHFWPGFTFVGGLPIDYLAPTIYFSEFLSILLIVAFALQRRLHLPLKFLLVFALINSSVSIVPELTIIFWLRATVIVGVIACLAQFNREEQRLFFKGLCLALGITAALMLGQIIYQESIGGWWYWLGERRLGLNTPGVAKIIFENREWLRPYATFSHPNSLAGFLLAVLAICSSVKIHWFSPKLRWGIVGLILLTGSRSATVAALIILLLERLPSNLVRFGNRIVVFIVLVLTIATLTITPKSTGDSSISQRLILAQTSLAAINVRPLLGAGGGAAIPAVFQISNQYQHNLWYQPPHNIWLLLWVENGVVGLTLAVAALGWLLLTLQKHQLWPWLAGWWGILVTTVFDHYWLTLPQNRLVLAVYLGLTLNQLRKH